MAPVRMAPVPALRCLRIFLIRSRWRSSSAAATAQQQRSAPPPAAAAMITMEPSLSSSAEPGGEGGAGSGAGGDSMILAERKENWPICTAAEGSAIVCLMSTRSKATEMLAAVTRVTRTRDALICAHAAKSRVKAVTKAEYALD
eukprot:2284212-Pleurochrysis_carterae.AAC.1